MTTTATGGRSRRVSAAVAGPALIVAMVLLAYRGFAFQNLLTSQHVDMLSYSLPNYCFLGTALKAGHVPVWDPYTMGGVPFAADPQSGWMYLPAMLVFGSLPCAQALRLFIVLQPLIAGLGMYWFLRGESLSRAAATVGGVILAWAVVGSTFGMMLAFSGIVAWLPVLLGAASRCLRSATWPRRLVWCLLVAVAWGQLAASFITIGIFLGTIALLFYGAARTTVEVRAGRLRVGRAGVLWGVLLFAIVTVNLASLLPRLTYISRSTLALGYDQLERLVEQLSHLAPVPGTAVLPATPWFQPTWARNIMASPETYLGALPLILGAAVIVSLSSRGRRLIAASLGVFGVLIYLLTLDSVVTAVARLPVSARLSSLVLHDPGRGIYGMFVAAAALAGFGVQVLSDAAWPKERRAMKFGALFSVLVAVVLCGHAAFGRGQAPGTGLRALFPDPATPAYAPNVDATAYLHPGPIVQALRTWDGRYLGLYPAGLDHRGYLTYDAQAPNTWGLLVNQRGMLFGLSDVQGYSSLQMQRYWSFVRAVTTVRLDYNAAVFPQPPAVMFNLMQVNAVVGAAAAPPALPVPSTRSVVEGPWALYELDRPLSRVSVLRSWQVVGSGAQALQSVTAGGFDPSTQLILERPPGLEPSVPSGARGSGSARYQALGLQSARITVTTPSPSVVLVRNIYDPNWRAWVDGKPAPVLAADYLVQGIPVPAGTHSIVVSYQDPTIGEGLAGTGVSVVLLVGAALALALRDRRRSRSLEVPAPPDIALAFGSDRGVVR